MDSLLMFLVCDNVQDLSFMFPFLRLVCRDFNDVIIDYPHLKKRYQMSLNQKHKYFKTLIPYSNLLTFGINQLKSYNYSHFKYLIKSNNSDDPLVWKIIESLPSQDFGTSLFPFVKCFTPLRPGYKLYRYLVSIKPWVFRSSKFRSKFLKLVVLNQKFELLRPQYFTPPEHFLLMDELKELLFSIFNEITNVEQFVTIWLFFQTKIFIRYENIDHRNLCLNMLKKGIFDVAQCIVVYSDYNLVYDLGREKLITNTLKGCTINLTQGLHFIDKYLFNHFTETNQKHLDIISQINDEKLSAWYLRITQPDLDFFSRRTQYLFIPDPMKQR